jgi:hypothetical protein
MLVTQALLPVLPYTLDKERAAGIRLAIDLRLRAAAPFVVRVHDGALTVEPSHGQRVDCHISADPVVYLLLGFSRITAFTARGGRPVAWPGGRASWR